MDGLLSEDTSSFEAAGLSGLVAECERFEAMWRDGDEPRIEEFLEGFAPPRRRRLLRELLAIEIELRAARGDAPTPGEYFRRCPEWADAVAQVFARETFESRRTEHPSQRTAGPPGPAAAGSAGIGPPGSVDHTVESLGGAPPAISPGEPLPERFGRYPVIALLGHGGFGRVYLARDEELGRLVAIKALHPGVLRNPGQVEAFLAEARFAAGLVHPGIVRVYDVGHHGEGEAFVVFEYVEGRDLAEVLKSERPAFARVAGLLARIAEAAHHAHAAGLIHRDLKPSNILVDHHGAPHIADFGLAVREDAQHLLAGEVAGTLAFMSPEQVRGETHRFDGRTDVWALGVILYSALTGRLPFRGRDRRRAFRAILELDPKPPRRLEAAIPRELERICLKCLAKRMADRYQTAAELADDLNSWLAREGAAWESDGPAGAGAVRPMSSWRAGPPSPIVPKGLRAFDLEDADFFPRLVPGPRDRDGLPESIRAWRCRIEEPDPARSFSVGLIYGPSGGGKSSFVRAGLIPRLARWVRPVYIESGAEGTEARLLAALVREFPGLPAGCNLVEAAAAVREGRSGRGGSKVLLVLDQFEQWLHAHPDARDGELVRALRHCDGAGLQAILLVRDDFWMAITRFLRVLEVRPIEGINSAAVEPFDARHAGRVLAELGRALGRLRDPAAPHEARFLDQAVKELAGPDGRVIPVRLTLLAEMLRHRDWTLATLRSLGGFEGIGEMFLEETFSAPTAPPAHRMHQHAARAVLEALLPEPSSDLKGRMRPASALRQAAGYADRPADFAELMALLDDELRMVTPVDTSGVEGGGGRVEGEDLGNDPAIADRAVLPDAHRPPPTTQYYQLTHDYLVPPVRQWLTRKQRESWRGRAELRLAATTELWRQRPEPRRLPALPEWLMVVGLTRPRDWSRDERRMMRAATRHHLIRAAATVLIAAGLAWAGVVHHARERADNVLAHAMVANYRSLPGLFRELAPHRDAHRERLRAVGADPQADDHRREVAVMLLYLDRPTSELGAALRDRLTAAHAQPEEVAALRDVLAEHPAQAGAEALRRVLRDDAADPAARLRAACALRALEPDFAAGPDDIPEARALAEALLAEHRRAFPRWLDLLGPAAADLLPTLSAIRRDPERESYAQAAAAEALAHVLGGGDRDLELARIIVDSTPMASRVLLREFDGRAPSREAIQFLRAVLCERVDRGVDEAREDDLAARQAGAATALAALGEPDALWPLLLLRPDPRLRTLLIHRLAADAVPARILVDRLVQQDLDAMEYHALLLAWAEARHAIPHDARAAVAARARHLYRHHPHPGVHAAAGLLLRRWKEADPPPGTAEGEEWPDRLIGPDGFGWQRGPNGHEFAILPPLRPFRMGSPEREQGRHIDQVPHIRRIDRSLAVSMTEVTVEQIRPFDKKPPKPPSYAREPGRPAHGVDWFQAARYCNWLSGQDRIDPARWCYPERTEAGMIVPADALDKEGYRLPTEAEWEAVCRAGTETSRHFGGSPALLSKYAWTWVNSEDRLHPVAVLLPNELGMFDMLGNVWEWCHDGPAGWYPRDALPIYPPGTNERPAGDPGRLEEVLVRSGGRETWRILRGGAFNYPPIKARSAHRDWIGCLDQGPFIGFRIVRTLPPPVRGPAPPQVTGVGTVPPQGRTTRISPSP